MRRLFCGSVIINVGRYCRCLLNETRTTRGIKPFITASPRYITSSLSLENANTEKAGDDFRMIYRFPYVVPAKVICKLKLYQTGLVAVFTGVSLLSNYDVFIPLAVGSFSLVMLGVMGEFFRRLIGAVYINSQSNKVKISHLNFFGNRTDVFLNIDTIVPISNTNETPTEPYVKIVFNDANQKPLLLSIKYGKIIDEPAFQEVFGHFKS